MAVQSLAAQATELRNAFCDAGTRTILRSVPANISTAERRRAMMDNAGITDEILLDELISLGVDVDTIAAVSLIPLMEVAWADVRLDEPEQLAVLRAAKESGLTRDAYELVKHWLQEEPSDELLSAWRGYIPALFRTVSPETCALVRLRCVVHATRGVGRLAHE